MSAPSSSRSRRSSERGGVSWVTVLLIVIVAGSGYLGYVWLPLYIDQIEVKQVVRDFQNQAVKEKDDALLVKGMVARLRSLGQEDGLDRDGRPMKVPKVGVEEKDITWERDVEKKSLHTAFEYERQVVYPFLDRVDYTTFVVDRIYDISPPDWGGR